MPRSDRARRARARASAAQGSPAPEHLVYEPEHDLGMERLIFFSDAVFAIAITLLALEIRLPAGAEIGDEDLLGALLTIWPKYLSYVISFLVIGSYWMSHHRMFRAIARYDRRLMLINLLLLLCIGFVPFPTAIIGEHLGSVATIFYALTMLVTGLVTAWLWWYATGAGGRLLAQPLTRRELWSTRLRTLAAPAIFLASIGLSLWQDDFARLSWLALFLALRLIPRDAEREANASAP